MPRRESLHAVALGRKGGKMGPREGRHFRGLVSALSESAKVRNIEWIVDDLSAAAPARLSEATAMTDES